MRSSFITDWVEEHARRNPGAPAVDGLSCRLSYGLLASRVRDLAGDLAARGVGPATPVLVALPTSPAAAVASLAVQRLGATAVEVDPGMGAAALQAIVAEARPRHAIVGARDAASWTKGQARFEAGWIVDDANAEAGGAASSFPAGSVTRISADARLEAPRDGLALPAHPGREEDPALVIYTSGSTGAPRGVIHTFRNIAANTRSIVAFLGIGPDERAMAVLPFHYTYGKSVLQTHLYAGASLFVDPRFMFPRVVLEAIRTERCTSFAGVPATYEILRRQVNVREMPLPTLRYLTQAGGPMRPDTTRWVRSSFAPARLFVMYGQTEATARLSYVPPERGEEKLGSIGIPIPGVELRVVDEAGVELGPGVVGHLVARGENVTPGYLAQPEATAAILRQGWLWTGDLARRDADGFFWLEGRRDDLLKIAGHRVSVNEIERLLLGHPAVQDAAVVGADDPLQGTVAVAYVVLAAGFQHAEQELKRACLQARGASHVPARVVAVDAIPRSASGKTLKAQLAARARRELDEGVP